MKKILILLMIAVLSMLFYQCENKDKSDSKENEEVDLSYYPVEEEIKQAKNVLNETVSLSLERSVFKLSKVPTVVKVKITNNTNDTITTGLYYQIENYEKNEWKEVSPPDQFFDLIGFRLTPSDSHTLEKRLLPDKIDYKTGKYRIVKDYIKSDYEKTKKNFHVYTEFKIER